jgi:hypothetical protein
LTGEKLLSHTAWRRVSRAAEAVDFDIPKDNTENSTQSPDRTLTHPESADTSSSDPVLARTSTPRRR